MYLYEGKTITITAASNTEKGDIVTVGDLLGVATDGAKSGAPLVVALAGVYTDLPSDGKAADLGKAAYIDADGKVTKDANDGEQTPTAYKQIGYFFKAVTANDTVCTVKLLG